jgi:hypothetical protein
MSPDPTHATHLEPGEAGFRRISVLSWSAGTCAAAWTTLIWFLNPPWLRPVGVVAATYEWWLVLRIILAGRRLHELREGGEQSRKPPAQPTSTMR